MGKSSKTSKNSKPDFSEEVMDKKALKKFKKFSAECVLWQLTLI